MSFVVVFFVNQVSVVVRINEAETVFEMKAFCSFEYAINYSVHCFKGDNPQQNIKEKKQPQTSLLGL